MFNVRVFITGASSDIGLSVCRLYLSKGWEILAHYRTLRTELKDLAEANAGRVKLMQIDFEDAANIEQLLAAHRNEYISCDALINCAALFSPQGFMDITSKNLITTFSVNVLPGLLFMRDIVPMMTRRRWGRVIHLSSIGVKFGGGVDSFSYALSKHALEFVPFDYKLWASNNVFVNVLRVGVTNTRIHRLNPSKDMIKRVDLIPVKRMAETDEIARAVWFFGSEDNSYITGQVISVSGGE